MIDQDVVYPIHVKNAVESVCYEQSTDLNEGKGRRVRKIELEHPKIPPTRSFIHSRSLDKIISSLLIREYEA